MLCLLCADKVAHIHRFGKTREEVALFARERGAHARRTLGDVSVAKGSVVGSPVLRVAHVGL